MLYTEFDAKHLLNYILAGDATLTVLSKQTNKHITFTVRKAKKGTRFNVRYIGTVIGYLDNMAFHFDPPVVKPSEEQRIFGWIWKHIVWPDTLAKYMRFHHHGNCARCGRKLTDPESLLIGLGPDCFKLSTGLA